MFINHVVIGFLHCPALYNLTDREALGVWYLASIFVSMPIDLSLCTL